MTTERQTPTHHYFWGGVFSNFYRSPNTSGDRILLRLPLWRSAPAVGFYHSEGYFMACKAFLFGDVTGRMTKQIIDGQETDVYVASLLERIIEEKLPKEAKALGRQVAKFDAKRWQRDARNFMFRAVWAKFSQNPDLARVLLSTDNRVLVEGSPLDAVWGVGLAWNDPLIEDEANWKGTNWLGEVLMLVRGLLRDMDVREIEQFDPFKVDIV